MLSAKRLSTWQRSLFDTAIYHCQQTVEKALKGWLVYQDRSFEKTRDLRLLVTLASEIEPKFTEWFDVAEQVSPDATVYRYPGEALEPTEDEFNLAWTASNRVERAILKLGLMFLLY